MASAIWLKRGLDTGMTAHGHHDFQLSDDTLRKVHIGHYTFWHKSVVKQPKNVAIAEDIFSRGYVGGEGVGVFGKNQKGEDTDASELNNYLTSHDNPLNKSIILVSEDLDAGEQKGQEVKNPIDLSGRYPGSAYKDGSGELPDTAGYRGIYPLQNVAPDRDDAAQFNSPLRGVNTVCFRGMSIAVIKEDGKEERRHVTLSTDHWGPNVYQGVKGARTGAMAFIKDMGYERGDFDKIPLQ